MGTEPGKVYVVHNDCIRNKNGGMPYKVGITKNTVPERYYGLGLKMPGEFVCDVAYGFSKDYDKVETVLHNMLDDVHEKGEWYNINSNKLAEVKQVCKLLGGTDVTDDVTEDIIESQEEVHDTFDVDPDGINPVLGKIATHWDAASDMKTKGDSPVIRRVYLPTIKQGVCYKFKILSPHELGIQLYCRTNKSHGPTLIDVFSRFDKLSIKERTFDYKQISEIGWMEATVSTTVPLTMDVADVVEIMKSLIEATKGKIVEACK